MADTAFGASMKVRPVNDPAVKKMGMIAMVDAVRKGSGKMQGYKDKLSDSETLDVVIYFRSLSK
jgi:hypothetical protein